MTRLRKTLNLKYSAFSDVTPEVWQSFRSGDKDALATIERVGREVINGVLSKYDTSKWLDGPGRDEFKNFALERLMSTIPGKHKDTPELKPIISSFNPNRPDAASFSTFIFGAITNLLWQYYNAYYAQKRKTEKERGKEVSLDAPIGEEGNRTLSDIVEDTNPYRFHDQEAAEDKAIFKIFREVAGNVNIGEKGAIPGGEPFGQGEVGGLFKRNRKEYLPYLYAFLKSNGNRDLASNIVMEEFPLKMPKYDTIYNMMNKHARPLLGQLQEYAPMFNKEDSVDYTQEAEVKPEAAKDDDIVESEPDLLEGAPEKEDEELKKKIEQDEPESWVKTMLEKPSVPSKEDFADEPVEILDIEDELDAEDALSAPIEGELYRAQPAAPIRKIDPKTLQYVSKLNLKKQAVDESLTDNVLDDLSAANILQTITAKLHTINPIYPKILQAWMDTDGNRKNASAMLNAQGIHLNAYAVYKMMNSIKYIIGSAYPESLSMYLITPQEEILDPVQTSVYRVVADQATGKERKVKISRIRGKSLKRLRWADTLLFWLKVSKK